MAAVDVRHNCGCGYSTAKLEEAVKHAETKKHILTVLGTIKPDTK